jgi:hypothetical protein
LAKCEDFVEQFSDKEVLGGRKCSGRDERMNTRDMVGKTSEWVEHIFN